MRTQEIEVKVCIRKVKNKKASDISSIYLKVPKETNLQALAHAFANTLRCNGGFR